MVSNKLKMGLLIIVVVLGSVGYAYYSNAGEKKNSLIKTAQAGENEEKNKYPAAPDFTLKDIDGNEVSLSDFSGKVVVIDFWATWCGPCRKGIPEFVEMQTHYGEEDLVVLGISVDQGDLSIVSQFAEYFQINYPVLYFTPEVIMTYGGIQGVPTTFIVDRDGKLRDKVVGYRPKEYFEAVINSLI